MDARVGAEVAGVGLVSAPQAVRVVGPRSLARRFATGSALRTATGVGGAAAAVPAKEPARVGGPSLPSTVIPGAGAAEAAIGRVPATRIMVSLAS